MRPGIGWEFSEWLYFLKVSLCIRCHAGVPMYNFKARIDISKAVCCTLISKLAGIVGQLPALDFATCVI